MKIKVVLIMFAVIFMSIVFAGCYLTTTNTDIMGDDEFDRKLLKAMKTWEGHHISSVVQRIGPPTKKVSDEAGGTIYIWKNDPKSVPPPPPSMYFTPPRVQSKPHSVEHALTQSTNRFIYQQNINKSRMHNYELNKLRQRMLAMKIMFYVRSNGTVYLAHLTYH